MKPAIPEHEFAKMNAAEMAAADFAVDQRKRMSNGVRKIPPPMPISPDRNPIANPNTSSAGNRGSWRWVSSGFATERETPCSEDQGGGEQEFENRFRRLQPPAEKCRRNRCGGQRPEQTATKMSGAGECDESHQ